jgi:hypothetical protein
MATWAEERRTEMSQEHWTTYYKSSYRLLLNGRPINHDMHHTTCNSTTSTLNI